MRGNAAVVLVLMLLVLACGFQGSRGVYAPDEGYYVVIAQSMIQTGDYLVPRILGEPWIDKPPLSLWGVAAGLYLLGHSEWGARAFHALCYVLTALLVYLLGRSFGGDGLGVRAGVIYATMLLPFAAANVVTPDTPLTLFTTAAILCFRMSLQAGKRSANFWKVLVLTAFGLAFLTKGPAALIPAAALVVFLLVTRQAGRYLLTPWVPAGLALSCFIGLGWYVYIANTYDGALEYMWRNQVVGRTISAEFSRNAGLKGTLIYLPVLLAGTLPWSISWWPALWRGRRRLVQTTAWRSLLADPVRLLLAAWIGIPVLILALANSRLPLYPLPVFPALALVTARAMASRPGRHRRRNHSSRLFPASLASMAVLVVILLGIKLAAARLPSENDMRALYSVMDEHLPWRERFEIVAVHEPLEGLSFYGPYPVERVTTQEEPYPFFATTEHLQREVAEMATSSSGHVFVCKHVNHASRLREALASAGISCEETALPLGYSMFACPPSRQEVVEGKLPGETVEAWSRPRQ